MTPLLYLNEEYRSVVDTLNETLRYDYGSGGSKEYYGECRGRLNAVRRRIDDLTEGDPDIAASLASLAGIANRVSLIERSRLGEFSWPFAETIRTMADKLLVERTLRGDPVSPIVHMIAEGTGYQIRNERAPELGTRKRIAIVAFPRQLKHHVLMHAIFGHELGHAAFYTNVAGKICRGKVIPAISRAGPLRSTATLAEWIGSRSRPRDAREGNVMAQVQPRQLEQWSLELMCDLFGLLLFGTAFAAAHRALLEPSSKPFGELGSTSATHPPLAVRRRLLTVAMRSLRWDKPTVTAGSVRQAESELLAYVMEDDGDGAADILLPDQVEEVLAHLKELLSVHPGLLADPPSGEATEHMVGRLARRLPPIIESVDEEGRAHHSATRTSECLYAGWTYWFGREALSGQQRPLSFLQTNRLCDHAMLQQHAIDISRGFER